MFAVQLISRVYYFFYPICKNLTINIVNTILPAENNLLERLQM